MVHTRNNRRTLRAPEFVNVRSFRDAATGRVGRRTTLSTSVRIAGISITVLTVCTERVITTIRTTNSIYVWSIDRTFVCVVERAAPFTTIHITHIAEAIITISTTSSALDCIFVWSTWHNCYFHMHGNIAYIHKHLCTIRMWHSCWRVKYDEQHALQPWASLVFVKPLVQELL